MMLRRLNHSRSCGHVHVFSSTFLFAVVGFERRANSWIALPSLGKTMSSSFFHCLFLPLLAYVAATEAVQQLFPDVPLPETTSHQCVAYAPIQDISVSEASAIFYSAALWKKSLSFPASVPSGLILYSTTNPFSCESISLWCSLQRLSQTHLQ